MDGGTDGASHRLTTNFSASLDSNGVAEIGLYSTSESGLATLGTGVITAFCHCWGTAPEEKKTNLKRV